MQIDNTVVSHLHESPEALELYVLGRLPEPEVARVEEHLLFCSECRHRLLQVENYVAVMRRGLALAEGVIALHATPAGLITLRVQRQNNFWVARLGGPSLDVGRSHHSRQQAVEHCHTVFRDMFPEHKCGPLCQTLD